MLVALSWYGHNDIILVALSWQLSAPSTPKDEHIEKVCPAIIMGDIIAPTKEWLAIIVALTGVLVFIHICLLEWILPRLYVWTKFVLFGWCCVTWEVKVSRSAQSGNDTSGFYLAMLVPPVCHFMGSGTWCTFFGVARLDHLEADNNWTLLLKIFITHQDIYNTFKYVTKIMHLKKLKWCSSTRMCQSLVIWIRSNASFSCVSMAISYILMRMWMVIGYRRGETTNLEADRL